MRPRRRRGGGGNRLHAALLLSAATTLLAASLTPAARAAAAPPGYCASALRGAAGACAAELALVLAPPTPDAPPPLEDGPSTTTKPLSRACCAAAIGLFSRDFQKACGWCEPSVAKKAQRAGVGPAELKRGAALVAQGCPPSRLPSGFSDAVVVPPPDACPSGQEIEEAWAAILDGEGATDDDSGSNRGGFAFAAPGPAADAPQRPSSLVGAASAAAATTELPPPDFGQGAVCGGTSTRWGTCYVKCTDFPAPTKAEVAEAQRCDSPYKGWCDGADGDGAPSDERGTAVCGEGRRAPDPEHPEDDDPDARMCFRCCTVWKPKQADKPYVDACRPPGSIGGAKKAGGHGGGGGVGGGGGGGGGGCFGGGATVVAEGGKAVALRDLQIGDRVLSADPRTGKLSYETVYFFVHQLPGAAGEFVRLEVEEEQEEGEGGGGDAAPTRRRRRPSIELTRKHLVPVVGAGAQQQQVTYKRAEDVAVGDSVMVVVVAGRSNQAVPARVAAAALLPPRAGAGLFAPLTTGGGHVVVDGVLASVHSDWLLDPLFEKLGKVSALHSAYERTYGVFLRALFSAVGPWPLRRLAPLVAGLAAADGAQVAYALQGLGVLSGAVSSG